jgi:hypothetical protein
MVWAVNGNMPYKGVRHVLLLIFVLFVLFLTVLPYTLFVLSIPILERYSTKCSKVWLRLAKPLSDAYSGPFKDKFRFWAGLLLLFRLILANVVPFLDQLQQTVFIIFMCFVLFVFFAHIGGPNKAWYNNLLDMWFILNVQFISVMALIGEAQIGTTVSVSFAFVIFCVIMVAHLVVRVKSLIVTNGNRDESMPNDHHNKAVYTTYVDVNEKDAKFRESVLDIASDDN